MYSRVLIGCELKNIRLYFFRFNLSERGMCSSNYLTALYITGTTCMVKNIVGSEFAKLQSLLCFLVIKYKYCRKNMYRSVGMLRLHYAVTSKTGALIPVLRSGTFIELIGTCGFPIKIVPM